MEPLYFDRPSFERDQKLYGDQKAEREAYYSKRRAVNFTPAWMLSQPKRSDYWGTLSEHQERQKQEAAWKQMQEQEAARMAADPQNVISKELFVENGGIESIGGSQANNWVPEVDVYEDYPERDQLVARILEIEPRSIVTFVPGTRKERSKERGLFYLI
jgi:hypothetical protein